MQRRRFGRLARVELPAPLGKECEVIQFERAGTPHTHEFSDEIAICVSGSGWVDIEGERHRVEPGQFVRVPAGKVHHMIPHDGVVLSMLVGYGLGEP